MTLKRRTASVVWAVLSCLLAVSSVIFAWTFSSWPGLNLTAQEQAWLIGQAGLAITVAVVAICGSRATQSTMTVTSLAGAAVWVAVLIAG